MDEIERIENEIRMLERDIDNSNKIDKLNKKLKEVKMRKKFRKPMNWFKGMQGKVNVSGKGYGSFAKDYNDKIKNLTK